LQNLKRKGKKVIATLMLVTMIVTSTMVSAFAYISPNQKVYANIGSACVKGANSPSRYDSNANFYNYPRANGETTNLRMIYCASNSSGTPILENGQYVWSYCIDYFTGGNSFAETNAQNLQDTSYWRNMTREQQYGISYAQMYGFPSSNLGVANCDAYAATQMIIWEYQLGYRTLDGTLHNAKFYNSTIKGTPSESAYWELANRIATHNTRPNFTSPSSSSAPTYDMNYNASTGRYELWLHDYNNVLRYFSVTTNNSNVGVYQSGNDLLLYSYTPVSNVRISLNKTTIKTTSQSPLILWNNNNQPAIIGYTSDPIYAYVNVNALTCY